MYPPDCRTWADIICDEAPPWRRDRTTVTPLADVPTVKNSKLVAFMLGYEGEWCAAEVAKAYGCFASSVRNAMRVYADLFECVAVRKGADPSRWRVKTPPATQV